MLEWEEAEEVWEMNERKSEEGNVVKIPHWKYSIASPTESN